MEDLAPDLLKKIQNDFERRVKNDAWINSMLKRIRDGTATQIDCGEYANRIGKYAAKAMEHFISAENLPDGTLYYNIAESIIPPVLQNNYNLVNDIASTVIKHMYDDEGLGMNPVRGPDQLERIDQIVEGAVQKNGIPEGAVENFTYSQFDNFLRANNEQEYKAGLEATITRVAEAKACKWCRSLEGIYKYSEVKAQGSDVYRRHDNCRCQVTYKVGKYNRDVVSKRWQVSQDELEARQAVSVEASQPRSIEEQNAMQSYAMQQKLDKATVIQQTSGKAYTEADLSYRLAYQKQQMQARSTTRDALRKRITYNERRKNG